ncbi:MAG: iojap-like protein [Bacteroidota bacterium]|nr:iojap-like protein [Bacteroidota bacterium]
MTKKKPGTESLKKVVIDAILDKKGNDVVSLDLRKIKDTPSDFFIITHGDSSTQVRAIYHSVMVEAQKNGFDPYHAEGMKNSEWVVIDFVDVVVHIFYRDKRDFYCLEELWNDAKLNRHNGSKDK